MSIVKFHGGCEGCTQQLLHGLGVCKNCCYLDANWDLPSLNNVPTTDVDKLREQIKAGAFSIPKTKLN
jgi:hypothetical protein